MWNQDFSQLILKNVIYFNFSNLTLSEYGTVFSTRWFEAVFCPADFWRLPGTQTESIYPEICCRIFRMVCLSAAELDMRLFLSTLKGL